MIFAILLVLSLAQATPCVLPDEPPLFTDMPVPAPGIIDWCWSGQSALTFTSDDLPDDFGPPPEEIILFSDHIIMEGTGAQMIWTQTNRRVIIRAFVSDRPLWPLPQAPTALRLVP